MSKKQKRSAPPVELPDVALDAATMAAAAGMQAHLNALAATNTVIRSWRVPDAQVFGANTSVVFSGTEPTTDVKDLAMLLAKRGRRSKIEVAREFTGKNDAKANSLLAQIRRLEKTGRIKFMSG